MVCIEVGESMCVKVCVKVCMNEDVGGGVCEVCVRACVGGVNANLCVKACMCAFAYITTTPHHSLK